MLDALTNIPLGPDGLVPPSPNLMPVDVTRLNQRLAELGRRPTYYPYRLRNPSVLADMLDAAAILTGLPIEGRSWVWVCPQCRQPNVLTAELLADQPPEHSYIADAFACSGRLGDADNRCGFVFIEYREPLCLSSPDSRPTLTTNDRSLTTSQPGTSLTTTGPRSRLGSAGS